MAKLKKHEISMLKKAVYGKHVYGLPIPEGLDVYIYYEANGLLFNYNNRVFGLGYDVITDLAVRTDTEIRSNIVSSAGGAVAGGMMFGPMGAMIGGRTKDIKTRLETRYLIITYIKNKEYAYICFELPIDNHYLMPPITVQLLNDSVRDKINSAAGQAAADLSRDSTEAVDIESSYVPNVELGMKIKELAVRYEQQQQKATRNFILLIAFIIVFAIIVLFSFGLPGAV